jgi:hypothetical protein
MFKASTAADAVGLVPRYEDAVIGRDFDDFEACFAPDVCCVTATSGTLRSPLASVSVVADGLVEWHAHYTDAAEARTSPEGLAEERG